MFQTKPGDFTLFANDASAVSIKLVTTGGAVEVDWGDGTVEDYSGGVHVHNYGLPFSGRVKLRFKDLAANSPDFTNTISELELGGNLGRFINVPRQAAKYVNECIDSRMGKKSLPAGIVDFRVGSPRSSLDVDNIISALEANGQTGGTLLLGQPLAAAGQKLATLKSRSWNAEVVPAICHRVGNSVAPYSRIVDGKARHVLGRRLGTPRELKPGWVPGFDGATDCVIGPSGDLVTDTLTLAAWVKTSANAGVIAGQYNTVGNNRSYLLQVAGGKLQGILSADGEYNTGAGTIVQIDSVAFINDGKWHHVGMRWVNGSLKLFIDGVEAPDVVSVSGDVSTVFSGNASFTVGAFNEGGAQWLNANIFDVRLTNRGWSNSEFVRAAAMKPGMTDVGALDSLIWYLLDEAPEVGTAWNIGSLGSAGDGIVMSGASITLRTTANDRHSRYNEEGYSDSPAYDRNAGATWTGSIVGTTALDGVFELNIWQHEWASANELFCGVSTATRISANADNNTYVLLQGSGGYGFDVNGTATSINVRANGTEDYVHSGVSNRVYKLTVKRGSDDVVRFLIDDTEVHTESSVTDTFYFVQTSSAGTSRPHPYWKLSKEGVDIDPWAEVEARGTAVIGHGMPVPIRPSDGRDIYGYEPTYTGQAPYDPIIETPCVVLNGVDDYIDTGITLDGATEFTVFRRAKYLSHSAYDLCGFYNASTNRVRLGRNSGSDTLFFDPGGNSTVSSAVEISDGVVHTLAMSSKVGGSYFVYVNGEQVETNTTASVNFTSAIVNSRNYYIGASNEGAALHHSNMEVYEECVWSRQLSDDEILWLDTFGAQGTDPGTDGLECWYYFADNANLTVYDASGNGNHGTLSTSNVTAARSAKQSIYNPFKDGVGLFSFLGSVNVPRVINSDVEAYLGVPVAATVGLLANGQRLLLDGGEPNSPFAQRCTAGRTFTRSEYVGDSGDHQQFANSNNEIVIYESAMSADLAAIVENQYT